MRVFGPAFEAHMRKDYSNLSTTVGCFNMDDLGRMRIEMLRNDVMVEVRPERQSVFPDRHSAGYRNRRRIPPTRENVNDEKFVEFLELVFNSAFQRTMFNHGEGRVSDTEKFIDKMQRELAGSLPDSFSVEIFPEDNWPVKRTNEVGTFARIFILPEGGIQPEAQQAEIEEIEEIEIVKVESMDQE